MKDQVNKWRYWFKSMTPLFWLRNHQFSRGLDRFINESLDAGHFPQRKSEYTAELNGALLWISNYPYAYAELHNKMPSRVTVQRLFDAVDEADFAALAKARGAQ